MTVGTVDVKNKKRKKPTFSFFVYSPSARTHAFRYQCIRMVVVAVGTADVKKKERRKKSTFYLRGWVVVNADGRTVVVVTIYARGGVAVAVGAADVKKKRRKEEKNLPRGVDGRHGWVLANMLWWWWWWW